MRDDDATIPKAVWQKVMTEAWLPLLNADELAAVVDGLEKDDPALMHGATTHPPPLLAVEDWPCEGACLMTYPGWKTGMDTVGECSTYFGKVCYEIDVRLGEPAAVRYLLNPWDECEDRKAFRSEVLAAIKTWMKGRAA